MSVRVMAWVWTLNLRPGEKLVLLAYADHADHDGGSIFPSVETICKKTGYRIRAVQLSSRLLERKGLLVADGKGPHRTNRWRIPMPAEGAKNDTRADPSAPNDAAEGAKNDTHTVHVDAPMQNETIEGARNDMRRVHVDAPKPSLTILEPSTQEALPEDKGVRVNANGAAGGSQAPPPAYLNRQKIPEVYLPYADAYHELTGQEPTDRVRQDWVTTFSEMQSENITVAHLRQAHRMAQGKFLVTRPGSLTNLANAIKSKPALGKSKGDKELEETRRGLAQRDLEWKRYVPMPDRVREQLEAFFKSKEEAESGP